VLLQGQLLPSTELHSPPKILYASTELLGRSVASQKPKILMQFSLIAYFSVHFAVRVGYWYGGL
jgi:hypothetical protein